MSFDIIEIALDCLTDFNDFEKMASEIMRDEGYSNIKPLGGVADSGQDAIQESFSISEGRTSIVFQYTLQKYLPGKIRDTIGILLKAKVEYHELIIVTTHSISSKRQDNMKKDIRKEYGINLNIFERKTIVNRLANYDNGIFHRHFPDIEKQLSELNTKKLLITKDISNLLESSMLRSSIAFTFNKEATHARKSIFDFFILGLLLENEFEKIQIEELCEKYQEKFIKEKIPVSQIQASLKRLKSKGFVEYDGNFVRPSSLAIQTWACNTIQAIDATESIISDIVDDIMQIYKERLSSQEQNKISRNINDVLSTIFQLFGKEISNQVLHDSTPTPVYLDKSDELVKIAKRQLSPKLGELLISVISETFKNPTEEQAQFLTNWSLAYLGIEIMNLDPYLNEFQTTRFSNKIFILDTDFILDCLVQEWPISSIYLRLIKTLRNLGCKVIIPISCLEECITHAKFSYRTYDHFGEKLLSLNSSFIDEKVGNVFVKGYYYGYYNGCFSPYTSFEDYLQNYFEPSAPQRFFNDNIKIMFPEGVEVLNPTTLLEESIPEDKMLALSDDLFNLLLKRKKSEYRSEEENKELAKTDARLFFTALYLNCLIENSSEHILGGKCYLITASSRYLISTKNIGIRDIVTTRPQSLIALIDLIGINPITPTEFASLFENPLLIYAVNQAWEDVEELLNTGIILKDKSIARLRWDLDQEIHKEIAEFKEIEEKVESDEEEYDQEIIDYKYMELLKSASSRGYKRIPELDFLIKKYDEAKDDVKAKTEAFNELSNKYKDLEKAITHFGKRKQRYLRKISKRKKK